MGYRLLWLRRRQHVRRAVQEVHQQQLRSWFPFELLRLRVV
jgi:hypothetical protein